MPRRWDGEAPPRPHIVGDNRNSVQNDTVDAPIRRAPFLSTPHLTGPPRWALYSTRGSLCRLRKKTLNLA